jgi:hypothetical protein
MADDTRGLLWQAAKEGDVDTLQKIISLCEKERISINAANSERLGATAIHYGKSPAAYQLKYDISACILIY